jgi:hypothetical protein
VVNKQEIIVPGKAMLVNQMTSSLLPFGADFVAAFHEAGVRLLSSFPFGREDRIVMFGYVQVQEVRCWEVLAAGFAAVGMGMLVVRPVFSIGSEVQRLVRW